MSASVLLLAGLVAMTAGIALFIQVSRLNRLLESEYPEVYAPFQNSIWGDNVFNPVIRFIRSGLHTKLEDSQLKELCHSVQNLLAVTAGLTALCALIGAYSELFG